LTELASIFRKLYKTHDGFRAIVDETWSAIKAKTTEAVNAIVSVFGPAFGRIKSAVQEVTAVLGKRFSGGMEAVSKMASESWRLFGDINVKAFERVEKVVKDVWPTIELVIKTAWRGITEVVRIGTDLYVGLIDNVAKL